MAYGVLRASLCDFHFTQEKHAFCQRRPPGMLTGGPQASVVVFPAALGARLTAGQGGVRLSGSSRLPAGQGLYLSFLEASCCRVVGLRGWGGFRDQTGAGKSGLCSPFHSAALSLSPSGRELGLGEQLPGPLPPVPALCLLDPVGIPVSTLLVFWRTGGGRRDTQLSPEQVWMAVGKAVFHSIFSSVTGTHGICLAGASAPENGALRGASDRSPGLPAALLPFLPGLPCPPVCWGSLCLGTSSPSVDISLCLCPSSCLCLCVSRTLPVFVFLSGGCLFPLPGPCGAGGICGPNAGAWLDCGCHCFRLRALENLSNSGLAKKLRRNNSESIQMFFVSSVWNSAGCMKQEFDWFFWLSPHSPLLILFHMKVVCFINVSLLLSCWSPVASAVSFRIHKISL